MQLHLDHQVPRSPQPITHHDGLLMMGSCFSEHIGQRLHDLRFNIARNPFGIVFNPRSMALALERILDRHPFTEADLVENQGLWHAWEAHGSCSSADPQEILNFLNTKLQSWYNALQQASWLMLTFGSAYVYKHKAQNRYVANCHKIPQASFSKELLSAPEIIAGFRLLHERLSAINPRLQILYTVSPVKHLRDGLVENSLSKAILIQSAYELSRETNGHYFPAYELVTDDLRDYRFYEPDMAHPNVQAIDYVWQKFSDAYFTNDTRDLNKQLQEINRARNHRLLHPDTHESKAFRETTEQKWETLCKRYPFLGDAANLEARH